MQMSQQVLNQIEQLPKHIDWQNDDQLARTLRQNMQWDFSVDFKPNDFLLVSFSDMALNIYIRKNMRDEENFSCGIRMQISGEDITLSRYNGSNHVHKSIVRQCHIHRATADSINRGDRKPESEDTRFTDRYSDLDGAFKCLCEDYNVKQINQPKPNIFGSIFA